VSSCAQLAASVAVQQGLSTCAADLKEKTQIQTSTAAKFLFTACRPCLFYCPPARFCIAWMTLDGTFSWLRRTSPLGLTSKLGLLASLTISTRRAWSIPLLTN